jgi:hypothetical protein
MSESQLNVQRAIYDLLLKDAQAWWYHRRLRAAGEYEQACMLELRQVQEDLQLLKEAVYANVAALGGQWTVHRRVQYHPDGGYATGAREGYGGADDPILRCCVLAGIPVLDFSVEGCDVRRILAIPPQKRPHEIAPWYGGTLEGFIAECVAAGARLVTEVPG